MRQAQAWGVVVDIWLEHSEVVGAALNTTGQIGAVISPIVVAKSVEWFTDWNFPLSLLIGRFAIGTVCWLFFDPRTPVFESGGGD